MTEQINKELRIWVDGAPTRIAIVYEQGEKTWMDVRELPIKETNNQAEYSALLVALNWLVDNEIDEVNVHIFADSQLMVEQVAGRYAVKNGELKYRCQVVRELLRHVNASLTWIPREENRAGQVLERMK